MTKNAVTLEITATPYIENLLKGAPFFLEVEMLRAGRLEMPNGMIRYSVVVEDPAKIEIVKEFVLKLISDSLNACKN